MLSLVIFDCDGVLFDSWRANVAYYNAVLAELGQPPLSLEWELAAHVLSSRQLYEAMFGAESDLAERALQVGRELDYGPFYRFMEPAPALEQVLGGLKSRYRLAMATNRGGTVEGVVREFRLDRFFDLAVGVRHVARPKPHPDVIERCLEHFAVAPPDAVYVGDAPSDEEAAAAAGVHFIAVGDRCQTALRVRDLSEVPNRLQNLAFP